MLRLGKAWQDEEARLTVNAYARLLVMRRHAVGAPIPNVSERNSHRSTAEHRLILAYCTRPTDPFGRAEQDREAGRAFSVYSQPWPAPCSLSESQSRARTADSVVRHGQLRLVGQFDRACTLCSWIDALKLTDLPETQYG